MSQPIPDFDALLAEQRQLDSLIEKGMKRLVLLLFVCVSFASPGQTLTQADARARALAAQALSTANALAAGVHPAIKPTIAAGPGAGTSPVVSIIRGNDNTHQVSITTGSSPTAGSVIATITFASPFNTADPNVTPSPVNLTTAGVNSVVAMKASSASTYVITGTLASSTMYMWNVKVADQ